MGARSANTQNVQVGGNLTNVAGDFHHHDAALPPGYSPLHQLPPRLVLTGRDAELTELESLLTGGATTGAAIAGKPGPHAGLQGMGGVGKTVLAVELAYRLKDRWPDAQIVLDLRGADPQHRTPVTPAEAMTRIIQFFRPLERPPEDVESLAPFYRSALTEGKRVLLLLDNAADAAQVKPLLPPENCLLLVTSRTRFHLQGIAVCSLGCLSPENSCALLLKYASRLGDLAPEAAKLCGHLPLALEVFAKLVFENNTYPVPDLLARLRTRKDRLSDVEAAFALSEELLPDPLRHRWHLLSVFPASFTLTAITRIWEDRETDEVRDAMQTLVNGSLVEWDPSAARFRLHDLVRQFCADRLSPEETEAVRFRHARHYIAVARQADVFYKEGNDSVVQGLALFDAARPHLTAAFEWLLSRLDLETANELIILVDATAHTGSLRLHPRERIRWLEVHRDAARLIGDQRQECCALGNLGVAYAALSETRRAIDFHAQALTIARRIDDRRSEGTALGNLGLAYAALGESREAIKFYEQYRVIAHEIGDRRGEGNALGDLGVAYKNLSEPHKAIEFHEQHRVIVHEIGDRRGEGNVLNNLGNAYKDLGEPRRAIEFYELALGMFREIGDRCGEGSALGNLGGACADLGETRRAIDFHEQNLAITREIGDRRGEGSALGNLGGACADLGETRRAIDFHEQNLAIAREIGDRRGEGNALGNLGVVYKNLGEPRHAIAFYEQHYVIAREIGDRRGERAALGNLGVAYSALGETRRAIDFYEQNLAIAREIGDRRGEGNALGNLGVAYAALGETREAIKLYEQHYVIAHETGDRRGEGNALGNIANALWILGERQEAIVRAEAALAIFAAIESPNAVTVRSMLAQWRDAGA